jgi:NTP pyrophosphatase (non-canonical NTP hydrolase)
MEIFEMQRYIAEWADKEFPSRQPTHLIAKILEEVGELIANPTDPMEAADLAILVLDYFHLIGHDMELCVVRKMMLNKSRRWKMNPNTMIMNHIPDGEAP